METYAGLTAIPYPSVMLIARSGICVANKLLPLATPTLPPPFANDGGDSTWLPYSNTGGTDFLSFDAIGLPGFQFVQDDLDYFTNVHHSDLDVLDHVVAEDLKQASAIVASFAYNAAMRPEKLPRKAVSAE